MYFFYSLNHLKHEITLHFYVYHYSQHYLLVSDILLNNFETKQETEFYPQRELEDKKEGIEIHFFEFKSLNPKENYGQVYLRTDDIDMLYQTMMENGVKIHPNSPLDMKPWGQKEFAL